MKKLSLIGLIALASVIAFSQVRPPKAADKDVVKLAWDYEDSSQIAVFRIYVGTREGTYDRHIDIPADSRTAQIDLTAGSIHYFTATAVDANGVESLPSNAVSVNVTPRPASPSNLTGTRITILVD